MTKNIVTNAICLLLCLKIVLILNSEEQEEDVAVTEAPQPVTMDRMVTEVRNNFTTTSANITNLYVKVKALR